MHIIYLSVYKISRATIIHNIFIIITTGNRRKVCYDWTNIFGSSSQFNRYDGFCDCEDYKTLSDNNVDKISEGESVDEDDESDGTGEICRIHRVDSLPDF